MFEKLKLGSLTTHRCCKVIHDIAILGTFGHCWWILQRKRTRGILNTRRDTGRHVTKHRLNINMLVPHLCSKYKNTGSSFEINNLPLQIAFLLLLLQIIIKKT